MSDLKPCPFCGGEARYCQGDFTATDFAVCCDACGYTLDPASFINMDGHNDYELDNQHDLAAKAWNNRRADHTPEQYKEALELARDAFGIITTATHTHQARTMADEALEQINKALGGKEGD